MSFLTTRPKAPPAVTPPPVVASPTELMGTQARLRRKAGGRNSFGASTPAPGAGTGPGTGAGASSTGGARAMVTGVSA